MYLARTPLLLQSIFSAFEWRIPTADPVLYLTFDDGPIPELTPWVLEILRRYKAKATFFCVGDNVRKHPEIFLQILKDGHKVGNHTYNHLNGWKTPDKTYLENVHKCANLVNSNLFRPPYGRITRSQQKELRNQFRLIMWDVLSGDFDAAITPQKCCDNVLRNARAGSIVVLHDNIKAAQNLRVVLPAILEHFSSIGYRFEAIS
ncbi:MAG: polysaccharide deacetylase family protein [Bacteroidetes bacterium]|nr:polysaccharide deacetylase family protein [Bacteroidota bacterium]